MSLSQHDERRASPRAPVDILFNKYVAGRPHLCRATDISRDGLLAEPFREPASAETHVGLQLEVPGTRHIISCAGRITRRGPDGSAGIAFCGLAPEHQALLDALVSGGGAPLEAGPGAGHVSEP
jgi:hypothetical protein